MSGSSQGQDFGKRRDDKVDAGRTAPGTADIERGSAVPGNGTESLVNDPTGAFKERP